MILDHIAIIVSSEKCLEFYKRLGFKESKRISRASDTVVFMESGYTKLEIFIDSKHPERINSPEAKGLRHLAFVVNSLEEISKRIEIGEIKKDWFGRKSVFVKDFDNQPIELIEE